MDHDTFVLNPGKPIVRVAFQMTAALCGTEPAADRLRRAAKLCLDWAQGKHPFDLPEHAWDLHAFECAEDPSFVSACADHDLSWALRVRQSDIPYRDRPAVPGRHWTTDIALRRIDELLTVAVRVTCSSLAYGDRYVPLIRPRVVVDLAEEFGLQDGALLQREPLILDEPGAMMALYRFLEAPERRRPVVVVSSFPTDRFDAEDEQAVDIYDLAERMYGIAHVYVLPHRHSYTWSDVVGKEWSVYQGAVRVYWPGLDFESDSPMQHPLATADRIETWAFGGQIGPTAYCRFTVEKCVEGMFRSPGDLSGFEFYPQLRSRMDSKQEGSGRLESLEALKRRVQSLEDELQHWVSLTEQGLDGLKTADATINRLTEENAQLRRSNDDLRKRLRAYGPIRSKGARPFAFSHIADWCRDELVGRLLLHPRAEKGLKNAQFEDLGLVLDALEMLAGEYRDFRMGEAGAKALLDNRLKELRLELGHSVSPARVGEFGDTYYVAYPLGSQERRLLELHLKRGNDREPRYCFRLYFFYDDATNQVVVGWLPSHLKTRAS